MRSVIRFQSQLLFRKSYKPSRIVRVRFAGKAGQVFRPSRLIRDRADPRPNLPPTEPPSG